MSSSGAAPVDSSAVSTVMVGDDGTLHVVQTLTLVPAVTGLDLSVPRRTGAAKAFAPTVTGIQVRGVDVQDAPSSLLVGETARLELGSRVSSVTLEYDVADAVERTEPSNPNRALALVTPLVVEQARQVPARLEIDSVKVLNVGCVGSAGAMVGCGTHTDKGWTVETTGSSAGADGTTPDVLAQMNMTAP